MASLHVFHGQHTMLAGGCGSGGIERLAPHDLRRTCARLLREIRTSQQE